MVGWYSLSTLDAKQRWLCLGDIFYMLCGENRVVIKAL